MDIIALTSLNEGTPLTLIEAMNSARPVVTTEVGGVIDILGQRQRTTNGFAIWEHGLSVPSQDAQAMAASKGIANLRLVTTFLLDHFRSADEMRCDTQSAATDTYFGRGRVSFGCTPCRRPARDRKSTRLNSSHG